MRKIFLLIAFLAGCQSEPGPEVADDAEVGNDAEVSSDASPPPGDASLAQASCARVVAAHERLVARCPDSLHGQVAACETVTGLLRPDSIEGCIRFHDNVPCSPGQILWHPECTDLFTVGEP